MQAVIASRKEIKIRMLERDTSAPKIASRIRVTPEAVWMTIDGKIKSDRLRTAVTSALGWPASRLWAD